MKLRSEIHSHCVVYKLTGNAYKLAGESIREVQCEPVDRRLEGELRLLCFQLVMCRRRFGGVI